LENLIVEHRHYYDVGDRIMTMDRAAARMARRDSVRQMSALMSTIAGRSTRAK